MDKTIEINDDIKANDLINKENYVLIEDDQANCENHSKTNSSKINILTHYKKKKLEDILTENGK